MRQVLLGNLWIVGLLLTGCGKIQGQAQHVLDQPKAKDTRSANQFDSKESALAPVNEVVATSSSTDVQGHTVPALPRISDDAVFPGIAKGAEQLRQLCARTGQDKVRKVFCGTTPPQIKSLVELQRAIGLGIVNPDLVGRRQNGMGGNAAFTFTGASSSLVGRYSSAINPRLIMFSPPTGEIIPDMVALAFVRGEQFVEIAARDPVTGQMNFYLVRFEQACNQLPEGCSIGELLTPGIEKNWTSLTVYEDIDVQNTIMDCRHCHQPDGEGTPKILRMQELKSPWTHFFRDNTASQVLLRDFYAAHGQTEDFAGVPAAMIESSDPARLEQLVRNHGFGNQPNVFPSAVIEHELSKTGEKNIASAPGLGRSDTWQGLYDRFVKGEFIAPPYFAIRVTDPDKLASMTASYQAYRAGKISAKMLPDLRNVLLDTGLRDMGFMAKAGLSGRELLLNACAQCHNAKLPQNISRAKFDVDLSKMSREAKNAAIERIRLSPDDVKLMPPTRFRTLTAAEIELLAAELAK